MHMFKFLTDPVSRLKYAFQRATKGYDNTDIWSIDCWFLETIVPMLEELKETKGGIPMALTEKEWDKVMDDMIHGFKQGNAYLNDDHVEVDVTGKVKWNKTIEKKMLQDFNRSMKLFHKYFFNLWT